MRSRTIFLLLCGSLPMIGCAAQQPQTAPAPTFAATPAPPAAPAKGPEADPAAPQPVAARCVVAGPGGNYGVGVHKTMAISNDGGWCRANANIYFNADAPSAVDLKVIDAPAHGEIQVHKLSSVTAVYYRATPGYVGDDAANLRETSKFGRWLLAVTVAK